MKFYHYRLVPYLPETQFREQIRNILLCMEQYAEGIDKKRNGPKEPQYRKVLEDINSFYRYFVWCGFWLEKRIKLCKISSTKTYLQAIYESTRDAVVDFCQSFDDFDNTLISGLSAITRTDPIYGDLMDKDYLRICMAEFYSKYIFRSPNSKFTDFDWKYLCTGYKEITGEEYAI